MTHTYARTPLRAYTRTHAHTPTADRITVLATPPHTHHAPLVTCPTCYLLAAFSTTAPYPKPLNKPLDPIPLTPKPQAVSISTHPHLRLLIRVLTSESRIRVSGRPDEGVCVWGGPSDAFGRGEEGTATNPPDNYQAPPLRLEPIDWSTVMARLVVVRGGGRQGGAADLGHADVGHADAGLGYRIFGFRVSGFRD